MCYRGRQFCKYLPNIFSSEFNRNLSIIRKFSLFFCKSFIQSLSVSSYSKKKCLILYLSIRECPKIFSQNGCFLLEIQNVEKKRRSTIAIFVISFLPLSKNSPSAFKSSYCILKTHSDLQCHCCSDVFKQDTKSAAFRKRYQVNVDFYLCAYLSQTISR